MQNISFKGCMPVEFYTKHPRTQKYVPVVKPENVKKCQNFVVRNLNKSIKEENQCDVFIKAYESIDKDYAKNPQVRSFYDKFAEIPKTIYDPIRPYVYLFTGKDAQKMNDLGEKLGRRKSEIFEQTGSKINSETQQAKRNYHNGIRNLANTICDRVTDSNGDNLVMRVFVEPVLNKDGTFKKVKFQDVMFYPEFEY